MDGLYCKVYLRPKASQSNIEALIARLMGGTIALRTVQIDTLVIDVFQNSQGDSLTEDFVQWPFYLEVGPGEGSLSRGRFIAELRALLQRLRDSEVDAVPACDFEDELV